MVEEVVVVEEIEVVEELKVELVIKLVAVGALGVESGVVGVGEGGLEDAGSAPELSLCVDVDAVVEAAAVASACALPLGSSGSPRSK